MRELIYVGPGKLEWQEAPERRIESDDDALVRPIATTTCDIDQMIRPGLNRVPVARKKAG